MEDSRSSLSDVLNYAPDDYLSEDELQLIRTNFKGNDKLLRVIRKIMIPTINDEKMPIENLQNDFFLSGKEWDKIPASERGTLLVAREDALKFIIGGLIKLKVVANQKEETPEQKALRRKKDSTE